MHALSLPTWIIHIASVMEWASALVLVWRYASVCHNPAWRGLAIAMLPALLSAIAVCVWHFFDNTPSLAWLGMVQAILTFVGNCTLMLAAWWLWRRSYRIGLKP
ncbi:MAG: DUF2499 domain-containing protein [Leptolyngbya sp. BL-A-14]